MWHSLQEDKMSSQRTKDIEVLSKRSESLKITNKASEEMYKWSDKEMSIVPALALANKNGQAIMPKSMISDLGWFNGDWMKFED